MLTIVEEYNFPMMVTGPAISRPALLIAHEQDIEFVKDEIFMYDKLASHLVPIYTIMSEEESVRMEKKYSCNRLQWPLICANDPIVLYMGFKGNTCFSVCDQTGTVNIRYLCGKDKVLQKMDII